MNKSQLVDIVVVKTGVKRKSAETVVSALVDAIEDTLIGGEKVQISGLGTFEIKERAERIGKNPKTQETISIPSTKRPVFTASKTLKEAINK